MREPLSFRCVTLDNTERWQYVDPMVISALVCSSLIFGAAFVPVERGKTATVPAKATETDSNSPSESDADAELAFEPTIYPDNQVFPSLLLSTATLPDPEAVLGSWVGPHLGDDDGVIGIYLDGARKGAKVVVNVLPNEFIEGGSLTVTLPSKKESWLIHPPVAYNFSALAAVRQPRPVNVTMEVTVDGVSLGRQTTTVSLRSINDCLFGVAEDESSDSDYSYLFAAYVNENHPWVDNILRDALDTGIVDSFTGYQSGDPDQVMLQIFAVWNEMSRRGLKYSDITTTSFESDTVYSQHVRLFEDSIDARQANCVDGTVLLAAVLRKIGLYPYLVTVPGHMFLAVDLDADGEESIGIETTMFGARLDRVDPYDVIGDAVRDYCKKVPSWATFEAAVTVGTDEIDANWDNFEDAEAYDYQFVDVSEARELGIQPIARRDD